ncbi:MAG: hypothetical protein WC364_15035 [Eubacteriales bacterium]
MLVSTGTVLVYWGGSKKNVPVLPPCFLMTTTVGMVASPRGSKGTSRKPIKANIQ